MGKILSITREKCALGTVTDENEDEVEVIAPYVFRVGLRPSFDLTQTGEVNNESEDPSEHAVEEIKYWDRGSVWLRNPHYEVKFKNTEVKELVLEKKVIDIVVDMSKKKNKTETATDLVPDLSAVAFDPTP